MTYKQFAFRIAVLLWISVSLLGCNRKDFYPSYVTNLLQPSSIILTNDALGFGQQQVAGPLLLIRDGEGAVSNYSFGFSGHTFFLPRSSEALANYQKVSGDDSYNVSKDRDDKHIVYGCMSTIASASIISDKDFNKNYPAGRDLAPIASFSFDSYAQFIANKYQGSPVNKVSMRADQIDTNIRLQPYNPCKWTIRFDTYPEIPQGTSLNITIKLNMSDGLVIQRTFEVKIDN